MTKRQLTELIDIQLRLAEAINYIKRDDILICNKQKNNYGDSYTNKTGSNIIELQKFTGSNLNQLNNAFYSLSQIILSEQKIQLPAY